MESEFGAAEGIPSTLVAGSVRGERRFKLVMDMYTKYLSNEKNSGWLGYIGDYTTQLYRDFNKPL